MNLFSPLKVNFKKLLFTSLITELSLIGYKKTDEWYIEWQRMEQRVTTILVGSGHPDRYSYEIPNEYLSGWGNLSGKIISIKRNQ